MQIVFHNIYMNTCVTTLTPHSGIKLPDICNIMDSMVWLQRMKQLSQELGNENTRPVFFVSTVNGYALFIKKQ
jgi:hypothetical protein